MWDHINVNPENEVNKVDKSVELPDSYTCDELKAIVGDRRFSVDYDEDMGQYYARWAEDVRETDEERDARIARQTAYNEKAAIMRAKYGRKDQ